MDSYNLPRRHRVYYQYRFRNLVTYSMVAQQNHTYANEYLLRQEKRKRLRFRFISNDCENGSRKATCILFYVWTHADTGLPAGSMS